MGVILTTQLARNLRLAGVASAGIDLNALLSPTTQAVASAVNAVLRVALTGALQSVFVAALIAAVAGLVVTLLAPRGTVFQTAPAIQAAEARLRQPSSLWVSPTSKSIPTSHCCVTPSVAGVDRPSPVKTG